MRHESKGTDKARVFLPSLSPAQAALRRLADSTGQIIWMTDTQGSLTVLNDSQHGQLANGTGADFGDWLAFIHPEDLPATGAQLAAARAKKEAYQVEHRILRSDGTARWVLVCGAPRLAPSGEYLGYMGTILDITQQREAYDQLARSEAAYRLLAENSSDLICHCDLRGMYVYVSPSYCLELGIPAGDLVGRSCYDFIHVDDIAVVRQEVQRQLLTAAEPGVIEFRKRHREGHYLWMSSKIRVMVDPVSRHKTGTVSVCRNITAEREIARQLRKLADENCALIDNSPDVVMLFGNDGRILRASGAVQAILGYEREELVGHSYLEFVTAQTREETRAFVDGNVSMGGVFLPEFTNVWMRKDGGTVHLSWSVRRSIDRSTIYATARDVTEAHRIRAKLHRTNRRLNTILESIGEAFFSMDKDWRLTYSNPLASAFAGLERNAALGMRLWEAVPALANSVALEPLRRAMTSGENEFYEIYYEPAGAWLDVRAYPHEDGLSVFFRDVTRRVEAQRLVRESEQRFREMIDMTPAGYLAADANGVVQDANPALCKIMGYAKDEMVGQDVMQFLPSCPMDGALRTQGGQRFADGKETVARHKDGHQVHLLANLAIKRDGDGNALSLTAFVTDITARKQVESQLEHLATHDVLTGLPNRVLINRKLQAMLDNTASGDAIAVLFIDLDSFKEVNDSMGHAPGDRLLREVGLRLQENMRPTDVVARLGGDEFVVAARCSDNRSSAAAIAGKLLGALQGSFDLEGREVFVSASIGITMYPEDGRTKEALFQNADTAMYQSKRTGRNRYCFFAAEMGAGAVTRMNMEVSLRRAMERNEFELHYQPRLELKTMSVVGVEALIRWNHPELGQVAPMQFIPLAEEKSLIEPIGRWVLHEACTQAERLVRQFKRPIRMSVNVSARQLKSRDIVQQVREALGKTGFPSHLLELELTETALIEDIEHSVGVLTELKSLGIRLAVDDFGTGYSGLTYLRRFPLDVLKLDRSFIQEQDGGVSSEAFVKAFVDMAHALNLSVVAEGVETADSLQFLHRADCDEAQGYLLGKPLSLGAFEDYLAQDELAARESSQHGVIRSG